MYLVGCGLKLCIYLSNLPRPDSDSLDRRGAKRESHMIFAIGFTPRGRRVIVSDNPLRCATVHTQNANADATAIILYPPTARVVGYSLDETQNNISVRTMVLSSQLTKLFEHV